MDKVLLEIIQPTTTKINAEFDQLIIPGIDGDFGVLPDHTPFMTIIRPGILSMINGSDIKEYSIHDGFVTVENNHVKIVCEIIESADEIDKNRAEESKSRAEKRLKTIKEKIDYRRAEISLRKAMARLSLLSK